MAKRKPAVIEGSQALIVSDGEPAAEQAKEDRYAPLAEWVMSRVNSWCEWRDAEYGDKWDRWERLWRGIHSESEKLRASERATIVTPALSEAVENAAAELEEAIFGRGQDYFDLSSPEAEEPAPKPAAVAVAGAFPPGPPMGGPPMAQEYGMNAPESGAINPMDPFAGLTATVDPAAELDKVRARLKEDLAATDFAAETVKAMLYGAVFGSGFGEIVLEEVSKRQPMRAEGGQVVAKTKKYTCAKLRAINPRIVVRRPLRLLCATAKRW